MIITVELTLEQWQDVMALLERGVIAVGFPAFVSGGNLMTNIRDQVERIVITTTQDKRTGE